MTAESKAWLDSASFKDLGLLLYFLIGYTAQRPNCNLHAVIDARIKEMVPNVNRNSQD